MPTHEADGQTMASKGSKICTNRRARTVASFR